MHLRYANPVIARLAAGIFLSALFVTAPSAFADDSALSSLSSPNTETAATPAATAVSTVPSSVAASMMPLSLAPALDTNDSRPRAAAGQVMDDDTASPAVAHGSFLAGVASKAGDVVVGALNLIGVRYRWGGNTPDSGLDCSGFVRYVVQQTVNFTLPRRAVEMSRVGEKVSVNDLKPGDLVFFDTIGRTVRNGISHVGIYIGHDKFVHSPSTGSTIRVDEMNDRYWETRYRGARRLPYQDADNGGEDLATRLQRAAHVAY